MIKPEYQKAALFCLTVSVLIVSLNYLVDLDKVHIIYALASPIRAMIAISIFMIGCHMFLVQREMPATFALDWILRSTLCLAAMFVCAGLIIMPGLFIGFLMVSGFLSLVEFVFMFEPIQQSYRGLLLAHAALPLMAGLSGGLCLWKLMQRTYAMKKTASKVWRSHMLWTSSISMLVYFNVAHLLQYNCSKNVCGLEREITALTFLISAAVFLFGCFRAWHLTAAEIIKNLYGEAEATS